MNKKMQYPSGTCGDLTWYCQNSVLYVQGNGTLGKSWTENLAGDVKRYRTNGLMYEHNITSVVISEGCTEVGFGAFGECSGLVSIKIPTTVKRVGGKAFQKCIGLVEVELPQGATVAEYAFFGCEALEKVKLPEDLTEIADCLFYGCKRLRSVNIPDSVVKIGNAAFCNCKSLSAVEFPDSLLEISINAFNGCTALKSVELRNPDISLQVQAFANCSALSSVSLYGGKIGDRTFENCSALSTVSLPEGMREIGSGAFSQCTALASISIPATVTHIGQHAFWCCAGLKSATISQGVQSIGEYAFADCTALETLIVPDSVKKIGSAAFCGATHVIYHGTVSSTEKQKYSTIQVWNSGVYYYIGKEGTLHIEGSGPMPNFDTCEFACYSPWMCCKECNWNKVIVHSGVESLGEYTFWKCEALTEIDLPESVTYIGKHCFEGCKNLRTFRWPARAGEIKSNTFKDCEALETVELPEGVSQLWRWSFQNCGNLRSINIPGSVTRISTTAFCGANLNALRFLSNRFRVQDGCLYSSRSLLCASANLEEVWVDAGTEKIADYAFYLRSNLRRVILPATVRIVEKRAFYGCAELEEIICQGTPPRFGEEAVSQCGKLQIIRSKSMERREKPTFQNCSIAVTRDDYATLINGKFRYYPGTGGELDIAPLQNCNDLVDIKGGFDFIIGLRANGEVVAARKPEEKKKFGRMPWVDLLAGEKFPMVEGKWYGIQSISASEGRVAALKTDGQMLHLQWSWGVEQCRINAPKGRFRSVAVYFDGIMAVDESGCVVKLFEESGPVLAEEYNMEQKLHGVEFAEIACWGYYHTRVTSAALTTDGQVFWKYANKKVTRLPIDGVVKMAVGNGIVAVISADHKVYAAVENDPRKATFICDNAIAVNAVCDGRLIVIRADGTCETFDTESVHE